MNVTITSFTNPFSFFCAGRTPGQKIILDNLKTGDPYQTSSWNELNKVEHGQYVAVMWNNEWVRGVVTMETQYEIWLVDHGIFIRPDEKTLCVTLPSEQKKIPSQIFEASIHGVLPMDKVLNDLCDIENEVSMAWNQGAIEHARTIIDSATQINFVPVALLCTKANDIVLGDLYLQIPRRGIVNIIDDLEQWPVFLEKNKEAYISNLSDLYTSRRRHRACMSKPKVAELPIVTPDTSFEPQNRKKG